MDFFIGDTHFGGKSIIDISRNIFKNSNEMDSTIINNWNKVVSKSDRVFVVGDFFDNFDESFVKEILSQLNGQIILIIGNHDKGYENFYRNLGIIVYDYTIIYNEFFMVSHEPLFINKNMPYVNIFAHVHDNPIYTNISTHSICVSCERINFTPISFEDIYSKIKNFREAVFYN